MRSISSGLTTMKQSTHIETVQLSWSVSGKSILQQINFVAEKHQCTGILGPNGSGKTSFLRCLYGNIQPDTGDVILDDRALTDFQPHEKARVMAVVLQHQSQTIPLLVDDIVRLGRLPHQTGFRRMPREWTDDEQAVIHGLVIAPLLNRYYDNLSGGEKQRVLIARAVIQKPEILILDEPANHLDIAHQLNILHYLKALNITVIYSLHDLNLAAEFCHSIAVMNKGRLVKQGNPAAILTPSLIKEVFSVRTVRDQHPETGNLRLSFY